MGGRLVRWPIKSMVSVGVVAGLVLSVVLPATAASATPSRGPGYWMLGGDGGVFSFGSVFAGSPAADPGLCPVNTTDRLEPNGTCWAMAATPDGLGYWVLNGDTGAIYRFGDATSFGNPSATFAGEPREFVPNGRAIVASPTGQGYWVLEAELSGLGSVLAFGDAVSFGDTASEKVPHSGVPVGMAATPDGRGYWIVDSDGGVFSFGDAPFFGSMGGTALNAPVVGMAATPDGMGYYLAASDGGVFAFGDAIFAGSMGGRRLAGPVVGIAVDSTSGGYWLGAVDGGVFSFGGAPFRGSLGSIHLDRPIFAVTSTAHGA
jgi:hypothetical protein